MKTQTKNKTQKRMALAQHLNCSCAELSSTDGETWCIGKKEYLVLTDTEANEKTEEYVKDSAWAFRPEFILEITGLDWSGLDGLKVAQEKCESINPFILSLIEKTCGLKTFTEKAISADGRGHFLSIYDGDENEQNGYFIYRIN